MSAEGRATTAPTTPNGRYRLKTHELAPVLLPKARASSSSTSDGSKAKAEEPTAAAPARPRVSITGVGATPRGRALLESVAFDPFSKSESFQLLLQNPEASSKRREDPAAVSEFRQWLLQHFLHLARTLQSLSMISAQSTRVQKALVPDSAALCIESVNQFSGPLEQFDEVDVEDEEKKERGCNKKEDKADSDESWRLMLRYATVRSAVPGEVIGGQNTTRSTCVYFLLNGHCTLSFRPMLLRDAKAPSTPSSLTRMHAAILGCSDRPVVQLRELVAGDCFGLDAAAFGFNHLLTTATAGAARQRNFLGLREVAHTYVLCLPYQVVQQLQMLQRQRQEETARLPPAFPYSFAPEAELFLRNTFLFQAMADSSRRFLAAHLRPVVIARQEYLFTPGQPVQVFIVITGQLTLGSPREEHAGRREEADLELELLQAHDSVGLSEALQMATSFARYCVVTSASGVRAYALSPTVLLMVLTQEPSSLKLIHEWIASRKSWFELRRATALAQRKKHTAEGSEHVVRLTLAAQRRSKLACSRCGWAGHSSTSASCVRVEASGNNLAAPPMLHTSRRGGRSREVSQAGNEQDEGPRTAHHTDRIEFTPVRQPLPPNQSPASPPSTPAHRKLQVDLMALRALQISKVSTAQSVHSNESVGRGVNSQEDLYSNTDHNGKDNDLRSCALTQSLQRLEMALAHDEKHLGRQGRR